MRKFYVCLTVFILFMLNSCATFPSSSSIAKWYEPYRTPEERGYTVLYLSQDEEPRIISSSNISSDLYGYLSRRYIVIGESGWNGPSTEIVNEIKQHSKNIRATITLYSIEYTDTRYGTSYYQGTGGTYSVRRYDYIVYFLVEFIDDVGFGLELIDLSDRRRQEYQRNTGAFVRIVYTNTPAFYANIIRNDIIISINNIEIRNANDGWRIMDNFSKGDSIRIEVIRNGRIEIINYKL